MLVAVPLALEAVLPAVEAINAHGEVHVEPYTGDLPAVRWWGQWCAVRLSPGLTGEGHRVRGWRRVL